MTVMQGTLADIDLASLAMATSLGRSSLRLEVTDPPGMLIGYLVLKAGRVVSATAGGVHGRNALHLIMSAAAGAQFRLVHEPLDYVLSSALASVDELIDLGRSRLAQASSELPVAEVIRKARRSTENTRRVRMMEGRLDEFDLATLLQVIGMGRSYVELEVLSEAGARRGTVGVKAGKIVAARAGDVEGVAAISALRSSQDSFAFAAFRVDADLGKIDALGSVSEILLRSQAPASRAPTSQAPAWRAPTSQPPVSQAPVSQATVSQSAQAALIMEGSLSEFDVTTLLQTVACGRQHCALEIFDDQRVVGTIHLKSGIIVSAIAGAFTAIPAIQHLVGLRAPHRFQLLRSRAAIGDQVPVGSISNVLLQIDPFPDTPTPVSASAEPTRVTAAPQPPEPAPPAPEDVRGDGRAAHPGVAEMLPVMEGHLADFDFRTLLEALAVTRQYSYLQIFGPKGEQLGEVWLKAGMIVSVRAGVRKGAVALKFLLGVSSRCRFRVLSGFFNIDEIPVGSVHELLAILAPHALPPLERAGRLVRIAIPVSFFLGGAIVFFVLRGGVPTATSPEGRPAVRSTPEPPAEIRPKEAPPAPAPSPPVEVQAAPPSDTVHPSDTVDPTAVSPKTGTSSSRPVQMGQSISTAQRALKSLGYDPGPIDNQYGQRTRDSILRFQAAESLPVTGVLDGETWSAIVTKLTGN